jgi:hypothetical protein
MKNRNISHVREHAKIYHHHYKPSLNIVRFLKSILGILISGSSHASAAYPRRK